MVQSINRPSDEAWVDLLVAAGHVYIRQEDGSILVFDLVQPAMPVRVGTFRADPSGATHIALSGDVLLAARSNSLSLFDLAQPDVAMSFAAYTLAGEAQALAACSQLAAVVVDGAEPGLELVEVRASGQPSRAGFLPMPAALVDQVYCAGNYVYAAQAGGLAVIDISQPDKPRQIGFFASKNAIQAAAFAGSQAYLLDADQKLHVLDLSAPAAPSATGTLDVGAAHDLAVAGGYVFASAKRELLIVDVSDPARPRLANQVAWGFSGTFDLAVEQLYLWAHDYYGQIFVYDITQPGEPVRIGAGLSQLTGAEFDVNSSFAAVGSAAGGVEVFAWSPAVVATFNAGQEIAFSPTAALTFGLQPAQFQLAASDTVYDTVYGRVRFTYYRPAVGRSMGVGALSQLVPPFTLEVVDESSGALLEPTAPFSVKVHLTAGQLAQVEPSSVRLYVWSGTGWTPLENSTLDAAQGILSAVTDELAPWTVLATPRQTGRTVFLPYMAQPPEGVDVAIDLIELTQSTQTAANSVPLVAGRATLARVYAHGEQPAPVRDLTLTLSARRDGALLSGSPLTVSSWAAFAQWDRGQYGMSFNFSLPLAWTHGNVTLSAELTRGQGALDVNLANNRREAQARFVDVPSLDLMLVPIRVIRTSGTIVAAPTQEEVTDWILRAYPIAGIRVAYHAPITFRGDLTTDREFEQLLQLVTDLRKSEGAPGARVYYGLLPPLDFAKWSGVGWVGVRARRSGRMTASRRAMRSAITSDAITPPAATPPVWTQLTRMPRRRSGNMALISACTRSGSRSTAKTL